MFMTAQAQEQLLLLYNNELFQEAGIIINMNSCVLTRVEAGSNTSTVTLRVVRGDEMGLKKAAP
jgi:recombinational DNA repair protein (RecF pathway)